MGNYLKGLLSETSTYAGLIKIAGGVAGLEISDSQAGEIVSAAMLAAGIVRTLLPDNIRSLFPPKP